MALAPGAIDRTTADPEVIARVLSGQREAFGELVTRYQGLVFTVVLKIAGDRRTAEDLLQETFLKAYRGLASIKDRAHFKSWLVQVATNEALKSLRRREPQCLSVEYSEERASALFRDESRELALVGVEETAQKYYDLERIGRALDDLPPTYRAPIVLRFYAKLPYKEIAERMGISLAATKFRIHYGVRLLKALVAKAGG